MSWLRCMFGKEREELHPNTFKPLPHHQNPSQPFPQPPQPQPQPQPQSHPGHPTTQHTPHLVRQPSFVNTQNRNSYLPPLPPETASPVQGPYHVDRQSQQNFQLSQTGYQHPSMQPPNFNGISHRESRSTISTVVDDVPVVNSNRSSTINGLADNMGTLKLSSGDNLIPGVKFVVGFDFGTTFSGFAVYRIDQGGKEMSKVKDSLIGKDDWVKQPQGVFSQKCPTVIAYNAEDKQLVWGWVAKRLNHPKFRRVERVKLCLEPSTPENMKPVLPESMNALDVVTDYLREMNKECLALIQKVYPVDAVNMAPEHILYCFTVPVGWSHTAHQSLRKAAFRAGLLKEEKSPLVFTYEPEAAALACYYESPIPIPEHSTMLVVDCGGGTVDTFMCRLGEQGDLCEVTLGLGEMIGATFVDANFFNYIRKVIGYGPFEKFRTSPQFRHAFDKLDSDWETMKRQFAGESTYNFNPYDHINLPHSLLKIMPADKVEAIPDDGIRIGLKEMKSFFDPVIDKILKLVKDQISQLKEEGHGSIDFLFIVGGFGCNQYLRDRILNDYEVKQYVKFAPQKIKAEAAVLRGAVWSGVDHQIIRVNNYHPAFSYLSVSDAAP
ncbi:hypothetical protein BKA69DRAFT_936548 [Paraphysoderma sedebokerense]|nr:hypothetical protein BKA69DRAFT_936548 [Paraphysoderma sedebokerense]